MTSINCQHINIDFKITKNPREQRGRDKDTTKIIFLALASKRFHRTD